MLTGAGVFFEIFAGLGGGRGVVDGGFLLAGRMDGWTDTRMEMMGITTIVVFFFFFFFFRRLTLLDGYGWGCVYEGHGCIYIDF